MRNIIVIFFFAVIISCHSSHDDRTVGTEMIDIPISSEGKSFKNLPVIEFESTEINSGKIAQGEILQLVYKFENTGSAPLIISSVEGSCGCTIPKTWPREKILPGETGEIEVEFNSDGKSGEQVVTISVVTNTIPSLTQLLIKTDIAAPNNFETK